MSYFSDLLSNMRRGRFARRGQTRQPERAAYRTFEMEALEQRVLLAVFGGDVFYSLFTNQLDETVNTNPNAVASGFVFTGRDGQAHQNVVNIKKVNYSYDDVTHKLTLAAPQNVVQLDGADGLALGPGNTDLFVGGAINHDLHKIRISDNMLTTATVPTVDSFHITLDPTGTKIWTTEQPNQTIAEVGGSPFGSTSAAHPITGDPVTQIAFANGHVYYTSSERDGEGFFGIIDLNTFTTTRVALTGNSNDQLGFAHSIVLDPYTGDLILFGDSMVGQVDISNPDAPTLKSQLNLSATLAPVQENLVVDGTVPNIFTPDPNDTLPVSDFDTGIPLGVLDQGQVDGEGHALVAVNTGHVVFLDFRVTGLVEDAFVATAVGSSDLPFLERDLDDFAPILAPASINGIAYNDADSSGAKNGAEAGVAGVTIYLDVDNDNVLDSNELRVVTDGSGAYAFTGLAPGTYNVREVVPAGTTQTQPSAPNFKYTVTVGAGETSSGNDFGNHTNGVGTASISDYVWLDARNNNVQDSQEHGVRGVVVKLFDQSNLLSPIATTTTDSDGFYEFTGLPASTYAVEFEPGDRYMFVTKDAGGNDALDSDVNPATGMTDFFALLDGESRTDIDAGLMATGIVVTIDYSQDPMGFFNDESRRDLLQFVADDLVSHFADTFGSIDSQDFPGGDWTARLTQGPGTGTLFEVPDLLVGKNELIVFAGARSLGGALGKGGPGGSHKGHNNVNLSQPWFDQVDGRGEPGAVDEPATDFANWGGGISFEPTANWFFGESIVGLGSMQNDFLSVAYHELTHLLGFGFSTSDSFTAQVTPQPPASGPYFFTGPTATDELGVAQVALAGDASHFDFDTMSVTLTGQAQETSMDPNLLQGTRKLPTRADFAVLNDIGWEVDLFSAAPPTVQIIAIDPISTEEGETPGTFQITRTGDTTDPLDVLLTLQNSTATGGGVDYTGLDNVTITIPAGESFLNVTINAVDDSEVEGDETIVADIQPQAQYVIGASSEATITITDNDMAPVDEYDYGDADSSLGYAVTQAQGGPRHLLGSGLRLGASVDADADGQSSVDGLGDDNDGNDDEDGVNFLTPLLRGQTVTIEFLPSATGLLTVWLDMDQSGDFNNNPLSSGGERVIRNIEISPGDSTLSFDLPVSANLGNTFMRVRFSSQEILGPDNEAPDGEIEEYLVTIGEGVGTASIDGRAFSDVNGDGIQDAGEDGIPDMLVQLVDATDTNQVLGTVMTDASGAYQFDGLLGGDYRVRFGFDPRVVSVSPMDVGNDDTIDSDISSDNNRITDAITIVNGEAISNVDGGFVLAMPPTVTITATDDSATEGGDTGEFTFTRSGGTSGNSGDLTVLYAISGDAQNGVDYTGISGAVIIPDGSDSVTLTITALIDAADDPDEEITLTLMPDAAYTIGAMDSDTITIIDVPAPTGRIRGNVFEDSNRNGGIDGGENRFENVTVALFADTDLSGTLTGGDALIDTQTTDAFGLYDFMDLPADTYFVDVTDTNNVLAGLEATTPDPETVVLADGDDLTRHFGFASPELGTIGDTVFDDVNGNGIQDVGEAGVADVVVELLDPLGTVLDTTVTGVNGVYVFNNVAAGLYRVRFNAPTGRVLTLQDQGGDDTLDSDADPVTGETDFINLGGGENRVDVDAGLITLTTVDIDVRGNGLSIVDGDLTPSSADATLFADTLVDGGVMQHTFTIVNTGDAVLDLTGNPLVSISGPDAAFFTVTMQPGVTSVAPGESATFTISFDPDDTRSYSATVSIDNNDPDENPYTFAIAGSGASTVELIRLGKDAGRSTKDVVSDDLGNSFDLSFPGAGTLIVLKEASGRLSLRIEGSDGKSSLTIKSKSGDGMIDSIEIMGDVKSVVAKAIHFLGNIKVLGSIASFVGGNVADQHLIEFGGAPTDKPMKAVFDNLVNVTMTSGAPIDLTVLSWTDDDQDVNPDSLTAPSAKKITVKGDKKNNIAALWEADVILTGAGNPKQTLGGFAAETVREAAFDITGDVGGFTFKGDVSDSSFTVHSAVKSFKASGALTNVTMDYDEFGSIAAASWDTGSLVAAFGKSLDLKGNKKANDNGDITGVALTLTGITPGAKAKEALSKVKVAGSATDLMLDVLADAVGAIEVKNATTGGTITLADAVKTLKLGNVDGTSVTAGSVGSIDVVRWVNGEIAITDVKSVKTKGDKKTNVDGAFSPETFTVNEVGESTAKNAVGSASIKGPLGGEWNVTGVTDASKDSAAGKISADDFAAGFTAVFAGDVGGIDSKAGLTGDITANIISKLSAKTDATDLTLTLLQPVVAGNDKVQALGKYDVKGTSERVIVHSMGNIGSFKTSVIIDSEVFAGVADGESGLLTSADQLEADALIDKIDIKGGKNDPFAIIASSFAASRFGKATFGPADNNNGGVLFGAAMTTFDSITLIDESGGKEVLKSPADVANLTFDGDARVVLLT